MQYSSLVVSAILFCEKAVQESTIAMISKDGFIRFLTEARFLNVERELRGDNRNVKGRVGDLAGKG
jgi:hypothetical protein